MKSKSIMVVCAIISLLISSAKVTIAESPTYKTNEDYIVEFSRYYGSDEKELLRVATCESKLGQDRIGDGGHAIGLYQYWQDTFNQFEKLIGEDLNIDSNYDQAKLTAFIFAKYPQYKTRWTSYVAMQKGGVYSFYSKKLGRHFTVTCKP